MNTSESENAPADKAAITDEHDRVKQRRRQFDIDADEAHWALSLSGGGIRSATFSLGVMQALARAPLSDKSSADTNESTWLKRFDYLSTVSGGGYIGSFFVSLFVPGRGTAPASETDVTSGVVRVNETTQAEAATHAYECLRQEPPKRIAMPTVVDANTGTVKPTLTGKGQPLEWLRENGRYLTPDGSGDITYAIAITLRNLLAVHYVIGTIALTAFLLSQFLSALVYKYTCFVGDWLCSQFALTTLLDASPSHFIVASPSIWWAVFVLLAFVLPVGAAFWLCHPRKDGDTSKSAEVFNLATVGYIAVVALSFALVLWFRWTSHSSLASLFLVVAVGCFLAISFHLFVVCKMKQSVAEERVTLTRWLSVAITISALLAAFALVETLAQSVYLHLHSPGKTLSAAAAIAWALTYATRKIATISGGKAPGGWWNRIPLDYLLAAAAAALVLIVAFFWAYFAVWLAWANEVPRHPVSRWGETPISEGVEQDVVSIGLLFSVALFLAWLTGRFPGFINLSSFAALYSARLKRAYLGASNRSRVAEDAAPEDRAVSEPHKNDDLELGQYYDNRFAPVHLINVCLNQTATSNERLVQYDRKGKLLTVGPMHYWIDGAASRRTDGTADSECVDKADSAHTSKLQRLKRLFSTDVPSQMSVGDWVGTSGAAFGTGMGRANSLSGSLLFGLANVRTGRWFDMSRHRGRPGTHKSNWAWALAQRWRDWFPTQAYLFNELMGRFHGLDRQYGYLSDGGHYDNTGLHPLLRKDREIRFLVLCDNGEDHLYQWDDLANVVRIARIDHGIDVELDQDALADPALKAVLATPEELRRLAPGETDKCASLFTVREPDKATPHAFVLVIKPRVIRSAPLDVHQYRSANSGFPQQSTADQFFDEAQWESYRKLGLAIGARIFGDPAGGVSGFATVLKAYMQRKLEVV
jgi:Patatin-like phospholipase